MKYLAKALLITLIVGCSDTPNEQTAEEPKAAESTIIDTSAAAAPSPAPPPAENSGNQLKWWDSLLSDNPSTRRKAIDIYKDVRAHNKASAEHENSELLSGYLKTFFSTYPPDFMSAYVSMTEPERKTIRTDLAHEFYAAGQEYKSYLDEYFSNIQNSCDRCTDEETTLMKDIRQKVEADVKRAIETK
ncbi:MAG: hypothetical protein JNK79_18885 [Chitinophagaceae bacterium]|nr:hypothetical protein [Chitinophagaceae bacterium]